MNIKNIKCIYFIGIGGIGMSALARFFRGKGAEVHGYDLNETALTRQLSKEGMQIHYREDIGQIPKKLDLVVFTPAIPESNQELIELRKGKVPVMKRSEVLGLISREMRTIAVAGTHGKTTTTTMIAHILREGGIDCSAFLGGISANFESNFVQGNGDWVVVEADEYDRSFLRLEPEIALVLSMDADHLDIYGTEDEVRKSFRDFISKTRKGGHVFINEKIKGLIEKSIPSQIKKKSFGLERGEIRAENISVKKGWFFFDLVSSETIAKGIQMWMPGRHNIENALAACTVALELGMNGPEIKKALESFRGIQRRFEFHYHNGEKVFIDDYAHHPKELEAAIRAAKALFPDKKITGIFQPHLYSRTRDFASEFAAALDLLDECILLEIYPAREKPIEGISSQVIFEKMKMNKKKKSSIENLIKDIKYEDLDVLMTMGAGDIDKLIPKLGSGFEFNFGPG